VAAPEEEPDEDELLDEEEAAPEEDELLDEEDPAPEEDEAPPDPPPPDPPPQAAKTRQSVAAETPRTTALQTARLPALKMIIMFFPSRYAAFAATPISADPVFIQGGIDSLSRL
jgi:hypothetical protein